ncbi:MAG: bifunctional aspartate kinase/diaminopimelate decarboxylase [Gammaproteobacteria bacterium]|nr:MAG: bifunctional aspartate kinase/diaminopimelate decarboxylase [Gammaproteobacteria bacterium]
MQPASDKTAPVWRVMKFGGTSVASAERWATIRDLLRARQAEGLRPVVVHSALAGVSNLLEAALRAAVAGQGEAERDEILARHRHLAEALRLDVDGLLAGHLSELDQLLAGIRLVRELSPRVHARAMALGELMATRLGAAYLESQGLAVSWIDARDVLVSLDLTHENERSRYLAASCDFSPDPALSEQLAALPGVILTQGFIARSEQGDDVLLGRGGSDTSAAYFAAKLQADRLEIWTDVPGLFSADPRVVPGARLLRRLSYAEAQEISSTGGSVLHPRCIRPVRRYGIPLQVLCSADPDAPGTLISNDPGSDAPRVTAVSSRGRITVVSMETVGMWQEVGFLAEAFRCFSDLGLSVDLVSTAESNVTVTLDTAVQAIDSGLLERLRARLEQISRVRIIDDAEVVSLVGRKIRATLHEIGPALEVFEEYRIHLVSQAANDLNLSFVVEEGQAHRLVQALHATLVRPGPDDPVFGPTWAELQAEAAPLPARPVPWWRRRRDELLALAARSPAAYVYDLDSVTAACERLVGLTQVDRVFYAMKANSNPEVLRRVADAGVHFECVSPGEIRRVLEAVPGLDVQRILFTPNFAPREEYRFALDQGCFVTLDNLHPLRHWAEDYAGRELILRVDTGQGRGHHEHVRTAGAHSKFGIPLFELDEARALAAACGARVVGLHAHTGSGILRADNWQQVAGTLVELAGEFPELRYLDIGGGLGVPEKPGQQALDMAALDASLATIRQAAPDYELWLEPGRYIVAEAGVLLATVTQLKGKGGVAYVGVNTGMNSLIRPALYGAYHEIVNLSRLDEPGAEIVNIVGPNCESGDRLGNDRLLPACAEGDVLLIATAGAYGYVMSSHYNLRPPAPEFAI